MRHLHDGMTFRLNLTSSLSTSVSLSSAVRAHLFFKEEDMESFKQMVDNYLSEASRLWAARNEGSSLLDSMTKAIDERSSKSGSVTSTAITQTLTEIHF
uniref:Uncharacterized protein n=1 Tax=Aegilops tauschii subsp. strangulata TaxID=200361 RepID=A0A453DVE0_AEGTS